VRLAVRQIRGVYALAILSALILSRLSRAHGSAVRDRSRRGRVFVASDIPALLQIRDIFSSLTETLPS